MREQYVLLNLPIADVCYLPAIGGQRCKAGLGNFLAAWVKRAKAGQRQPYGNSVRKQE